MSEQKPLNIYQKILEVKKSIDKLSKDTEGYKYSYVSGTQILSKIKSKMDEVGIILEPHIKPDTKQYQIHQYETLTKQGELKKNIDFLVSAEMIYKWINVDNPEDYTIVDWATFGQQDEISKAFGSGLTYSERYFLLKYFGVPTDDDDPDKKQDTKQYVSGKKLSSAQINRLFAIAKTKGMLQELKRYL